MWHHGVPATDPVSFCVRELASDRAHKRRGRNQEAAEAVGRPKRRVEHRTVLHRISISREAAPATDALTPPPRRLQGASWPLRAGARGQYVGQNLAGVRSRRTHAAEQLETHLSGVGAALEANRGAAERRCCRGLLTPAAWQSDVRGAVKNTTSTALSHAAARKAATRRERAVSRLARTTPGEAVQRPDPMQSGARRHAAARSPEFESSDSGHVSAFASS